MFGNNFLTLLLLFNIAWTSKTEIRNGGTSSLKSREFENEDNEKSSLAFVFDTTGSMYNDLRQLREGAEMILKTALEDSNVIEDFVFVPFHDPAVGPATVTKDKEVFKAALNIVRVYGGGDCPEKSLGGIQLALNVGRPRSFIYVFTDATASDHRLVGNVLDSVQRKQSQVVFILTGHCNDLHRPHYKVYQQIAAASSGQVFNLNKTNVHKVLDFVRSSIKGRMVNLGSALNPAGYNYTQNIPIDSSLGEVTVSVSGDKPAIKVVNPSGEELTGPPKLVTTLDLNEIMVVKVLQPEPGNWTITTGSAEDFSVKVVGLSNLTFDHGFSVEPPASMAETSYRPLQGTYNYLLISLSQTDRPVEVSYAEIVSLDGRTLFEVPLKVFDGERKVYLADPFMPPDEFFYIAINGKNEYKQELRRIGATAVKAKAPDVPYLSVLKKVEARLHQTVALHCDIESLVPVTAMWTKDTMRIQQQISSLQSTSLEYVIEDMQEENVGTYRCVARNVAGLSKAATELVLFVEQPQVTITPQNITLEKGNNVTISCTVVSDALLTKHLLIFNGTQNNYAVDALTDPNMEGIYVFNKTLYNVTVRDSGIFSCLASNRGGKTNQTSYLTVQMEPSAQILGPHTLTKPIHTDIQLVCDVENAEQIKWVHGNTVIKEVKIDGNSVDMLVLKNVSESSVWSCVAVKGSRNVSDSVEIILLIKPQVSIEGSKNLTIMNGSRVDIVCIVVAKPEPRIIWHRETERFLNNTITVLKENVYRSVLTLDSTKEMVNGTYFCFGENSEGIHQDSVTVSVRRKMYLIEGFQDIKTQLYSQVQLTCKVSSYPAPTIQWYHNNTVLTPTENVYLSENNSALYITRVDFDSLGSYMCNATNVYESLYVKGRLDVVGLESPEISKEKKEIFAQKGNSAIIPCRINSGNPHPTVTWHYESNSTNSSTLPDGIITQTEQSELIILNVDTHHGGLYKCTAENILGSDVYEVNFVVQYPPMILQESTASDSPVRVEAGRKISLSCKAAGVPPPVVVWRKNHMPIGYSRNVHLTESNELTIENATEYDSGLFTCNVTSALGSVQRNFTVTVYETPKITRSGIEPQLEVVEGDLVELRCQGRGVPRPELTWLHNGQVMTDSKKRVDEFGLRFIANLTDFGEYTCALKNEYGNQSLTYFVYIWVPPSIEPPSEVFRNVVIGDNVSLNCDAVGFPIPHMLWLFQDEVMVENTTALTFNEYGNLNITNVTNNYEGVYTCVAENEGGLAKKAFYLKVNEPPKIIQDNYTGPYLATNRDSELVISCKVTGKPVPFIMWTKDGRFLDGDGRYEINADGSLIIRNPSQELSGSYTCSAKNEHGTANKTFAVEIYPVLPTRLQADESQSTVTVLKGANATVDCPVHISNADKVKWYKDAILIATGTLTLRNVTRDNSTTYACVVSNSIGSTYGKIHVDVQWKPQFIGEGGVKSAVRGEDVYLRCESDGKPSAKTKWLFNSKALVGEDEPALKLLNVQLHNSGVYQCVVSNKHGTIDRRFNLEVFEPPFISEFDLLDVQLREGMNATLDCAAAGSPAPLVTWNFNNTNWHVHNTSISTNNASERSEGLFRCDATNKAGRTYIVYRVSVTCPAKVGEIDVFRQQGGGETVDKYVEVLLNTHIRLSCSASGKPAPKIQWLRDGNVLSQNVVDTSYADLVLEASHSGFYMCVASNEGGVDERRIKLEVLEPPKIFQDVFGTSTSNEKSKETKLEVLSGQSFFLHCHPYGNPMPEIYWFKDDLPLRLFDDSIISKDYGEVLVSNAATFDQSGNYTCVARNKVGNTSSVYLVDVLVPPPAQKETIHHIRTRFGKQLNLTCPVEGSPVPSVVWVKHPYMEISGNSQRIDLVHDDFTLIINRTEISDSGKYSCVMTNKVGTTEVIFNVTIEKQPSIAGNVGNNIVESHVVPYRRSVVLKCQSDGHPVPTIHWLKDTQPLSDNMSNVQRVLGDSLLAIWSVGTRDVGQYICVAENSAGTAYRRYNVLVKVPGKWSSWSNWSYCNVTCGTGYQHRARSCQFVDDYNVTYDNTTKSEKIVLDETMCKGVTSDKRKCHLPPCEDASNGSVRSGWGRWSQCSATCGAGAGTMTRSRRCKSRACTGSNVQIKKCPNLPKCSSRTDHNPSKNEVYSSKEDISGEMDAYVPEAVFEMQPEQVNSQYSTDEQIYARTEFKYPVVYFEVNVTDNLDRSYRGKCDPGYWQNNMTSSCVDIDECIIESNQCHSTQICENTAGAYRCACPKGFVSLGVGQRCLDINECETGRHGCEYACVNAAGGFVCACPARLRLHTDRRRCVPPALYRRPYSYEELETSDQDDYLSATIDFPVRHNIRIRN